MSRSLILLEASIRVVAVLSAVLSLSAPAAADEKSIVWLVHDWPPLYILKNGAAPTSPDNLGNGIVDRELVEVIHRLPAYKHSFLLTNIPRTWAEMSVGRNYCYGSAFKTPEREKIAYFAPAMVTAPVSLIVRQEQEKEFESPSAPVSLNSLIHERSNLSGYLETGRSYSVAIDDVVKNPGNNVRRLVVPYTGHLLRLLDAGRMDYTLEYPFVVEFENRIAPFKHPLATLQINEVPALATGYIACTRNEWGKRVIADIELALRDAARAPAYRNAQLEWLSPALANRLRAQTDAFYDSLANQK